MPTRKDTDKPPFPLVKHASGQWKKRIAGRDFYFGVNRDEALAAWVRFRDNGFRHPAPGADGELTVAAACNNYLTYKKQRVASGELSGSTWSQYFNVCGRLVEELGGTRIVSGLRPSDFAELRAKAAKRLSARTLGQYVVLVRSVFEWCYQSELLPSPVRYGSSFDRPARRLVRLDRKRKGLKLIDAKDLQKMLAKADPALKACLLLGVNCAYGSSDCSRLNRTDLEAEAGWLSVGREKTGEDRRCWLWPQTVAALAAAAKIRPEPKNPAADRTAVFLTREGHRLVRHTDRSGEGKVVSRRDSLGDAFNRLAKKCGLTLAGRFGVLRHTARTLMDNCRDVPAARLVMGHSSGAIDREYVERIEDSRIQAVCQYVLNWLYPNTPPDSGTKSRSRRP